MSANLSTKPLEELVKEVPSSLRSELRTYIESLLTNQTAPRRPRLRQDWANALRQHKYTSVELQHLAARWRVE